MLAKSYSEDIFVVAFGLSQTVQTIQVIRKILVGVSGYFIVLQRKIRL